MDKQTQSRKQTGNDMANHEQHLKETLQYTKPQHRKRIKSKLHTSKNRRSQLLQKCTSMLHLIWHRCDTLFIKSP